MQTKSSRIRIARLVMAGLGLIALTAFILHLNRAHFVANQKVASDAATAQVSTPAPKSAADWSKAIRQSPIAFQKNEGQTGAPVRYVAHGAGYELFLTNQEAVVTLRQPVAPRAKSRIRGMRENLRPAKNSVIRLQLDGANANPEVTGVDLLAAHTNYFIGSDPKNWHTNVPSYGQVKYHDVYPGVDLVFYGNQRRLEYDLIVAPGADPSKIAFDISGAKDLKLDARGNLVMRVVGGKVELQKPTIYQERNGQKTEIAGNYVIAPDHRVMVALSKYDMAQPLVIDPALDYSTFLGGTSDDMGNGIAVDKNGNAYIAGTTMSTDFPTTTGAIKVAPPNSTPAVFVTVVNPTGTAPLVNSTYLSGTGGDQANAIAIDAAGNIYVTGQSFSTDFPTTPTTAFIPGPLGSNPGGTAFLTVLNGNNLVYSTYLGGTNGDEGWGVAADANAQAYITGQAFPSAFTVPGTAGTFPSPAPNPIGSAFLARIDTTKSAAASLIYYTFLAGTGAGINGSVAEQGFAVAADTNSNAYITGFTSSADFPTTTNGYLQAPFTGAANGVVFVSEINTATTGTPSLVYSGYLAGTNAAQNLGDFGLGITLGPNNVAYVAGTTTSADFPTTAGAIQPTVPSPNGAAFVALVNTAASGTASLQYSTFFGGRDGETATSIAADSTGNAYVAGDTSSTNLPVTPGALLTTLTNPGGEGFVLKLNPSPTGTAAANKLYATYLGGSGDGLGDGDIAQGIAIDSNNNAYVTGQTVSHDFPHTMGVFQTALSGPSDAFVSKLGLVATLTATPNPLAFGTQLLNTPTAAMTVTVTNNSGGTLPVTFVVTGANAGDFAAASGGTNGCGATLAAAGTCTVDVVFTPSVVGAEAATLTVGTAPNTVAVALTGAGSNLTATPNPLAFGNQTLNTPSAAMTVTVTNNSAGTLPVAFAVTGPNGADFAAASGATNGCSATLAAAGTCTISVIFTPTLVPAGAESGTLTVGTAPNSVAVALTGTGTAATGAFTVTAPATFSLVSGVSGAIPVTVTGSGGFTGTVNLTCAGGTANVSSCSMTPTSVNITGGTPTQMATANVVATISLVVPPDTPKTPPTSSLRQVVFLALGMMMLFTIPITQRRRTRLGMVAATLVFVVVAGCGGGGGPHTGTGTVTITGTAPGSPALPPQTATVNLTITK
jgi:hypothetical protein